MHSQQNINFAQKFSINNLINLRVKFLKVSKHPLKKFVRHSYVASPSEVPDVICG